jgi:hypothetical protein
MTGVVHAPQHRETFCNAQVSKVVGVYRFQAQTLCFGILLGENSVGDFAQAS